MLDFNLYTDYCSVFGDDKDSGKILYSFVTWQEDRLLPQMNQFKDTLFDSIKECNETASNLTISEKRNVIAESSFAPDHQTGRRRRARQFLYIFETCITLFTLIK